MLCLARIFPILLAVALAGCGGNQGDRAVTGAALGAIGGVGIGAIAGGVGIPAGALIGAGVGAGIGLVTNPDQANLGRPIYKR